MGNKPKILYTVYRKSDDKLMILDGTMPQCLQVLKIKKNTFYVYLQRGEKSPYIFYKSTREEVERDMNEGLKEEKHYG